MRPRIPPRELLPRDASAFGGASYRRVPSGARHCAASITARATCEDPSMTEDRPALPAALQRALFVETGYRCAVPACGATSPLEIDHIIPWAEVREHSFENLIVLCANHHGQKASGASPRSLDRQALQAIKHNLARVNGRYGDIERRILDYFVERPDATSITLPEAMDILLMRLVSDALLDGPHPNGGIAIGDHRIVGKDRYDLTAAGQDVVAHLREAQAIE